MIYISELPHYQRPPSSEYLNDHNIVYNTWLFYLYEAILAISLKVEGNYLKIILAAPFLWDKEDNIGIHPYEKR